MTSVRLRRRNRGRSRTQRQQQYQRMQQEAYRIIKQSFSASMNSWGGTRCPGCGIEVEPQWVLPFKIEYGDGWIRGQNTACSGPGRNFVKCPGEWDWY